MVVMAEERAARLLRSGATMLSECCPMCNYPLLKLGEDIWCPSCDRKVVIVREGEEVAKAAGPFILASVEEVILAKVQEIAQRIKAEKDPNALSALSSTLYTLLRSLSSLKQFRKK